MDNDQLNILENLRNVYSYAFIETAPYNFFMPKADRHIPVRLTSKIYHCFACGRELVIHYRRQGDIYISRSKFERQRELYRQKGLDFPTETELATGRDFVYYEDGYCESCGDCPTLWTDTDEIGQRLYALCLELYRGDEQLISDARQLMEAIIKEWLDSLTSARDLAGYDLSGDSKIRDLLCSVILREALKFGDILTQYLIGVELRRAAIVELLAAAGPQDRRIYTLRPSTVYEPLTDEFYHEYTVAFPEPDTVDANFYVKNWLRPQRVRLFIEQRRVATVQELIAQAGILNIWLDMFINHVMKLRA